MKINISISHFERFNFFWANSWVCWLNLLDLNCIFRGKNDITDSWNSGQITFILFLYSCKWSLVRFILFAFRELEPLLKRFSFATRGSGDIFNCLTNQNPKNPPDCPAPDHQEKIPDLDQIHHKRFTFLICLNLIRVSSRSSLTTAKLAGENGEKITKIS